MSNHILTTKSRTEEKFLRKKTVDFNFQKHGRGEINALISKMREVMSSAKGIGLSANQIGLNFKVFVAEVPKSRGTSKFYAVFNPKIEKVSGEIATFEEGCLSVPYKYGEVERPQKITISGFNKSGRPIKIKAWGLLARVFQHEIEHLNGQLFTDKAKRVYEYEEVTKFSKTTPK